MAECTAVVHTRAGELVKTVLSLYCTSRFSESFIQKTVTSQGLHRTYTGPPDQCGDTAGDRCLKR